MNQLSKTQQQAVTHKEGPLLLLAGPGSGKTRVITYRTKYLIEEYGVKPEEILVITFTKAASKEMKERFLDICGKTQTRVSFGTFHAVFFGILKHAYGYKVENILREEVKHQYLKEIVQKLNLELEDEGEFIGSITGEISRFKNEQGSGVEFLPKACGRDIFQKIYMDYDNRLRRNNYLDFDDMLVYCYELFKERKDILGAWQRKYTYILIDEFQDINRLQYEIVRMLAAPKDNLFVVGDDDQSIYGFRGAKPEIMLHFEKDYKKCKRLLLDTNYRSSQKIVEASLKVISQNGNRFQKDIKAFQEGGFPIIRHDFENQTLEGRCIVEKIISYREKGGSYGDIAVLFRTNTQPRNLVERLLEYNIPFRMKDSLPNLFEHWVSKDVLTYIRMALGSRKRSDFLQVMNRPKRYIGRECLDEEQVSFEALLCYYEEKPWVCKRIEQLEHDIRMISNMSPYGAVHYIRNIINYEEYLKEYAVYRHMKETELLEVLDELQASAKNYKTFEAWFLHMEEYTKELKKQVKEQESNPDSVTLATMHSSKGLEYRIVFIIDANEDITPYKKAVLDEEIEEERRMFYVAMTRAKELLYVFSIKEQYNKKLSLSRFVEELEDERE